MTTYERLDQKKNVMHITALTMLDRGNIAMAKMWQRKALDLNAIMRDMPISEAQNEYKGRTTENRLASAIAACR